MQYKIPPELYRWLTSDSSLHNTVMLQAIQLSHISEPSPSADVSPVQKPIHATDYQSRSASQPQGAKSPTSPYKTAQYRDKTPPRPYTARPAFPSSSSSPVGPAQGHKSRSFSSNRGERNRSSSRLPKVALIPPIERNTLIETKNSLSIDPRLIPGNRISSPIDLGHNPRAKMATATDHRVVIGSNVGSHLVTQRVQIMLATRVIELVPIRVIDRLTTETILEAEIRIARVLAGAHL